MRFTLIAGLVAIALCPVGAEAREVPQTLESGTKSAFTGRAPMPLGPRSGSVFNIYPRETLLSWSRLPNATSYVIEVEYLDPSNNQWLPEDAPAEVYGAKTTYTFYFVGAQPGRWRVQGVDRFGSRTAFSKWWTFRYTSRGRPGVRRLDTPE